MEKELESWVRWKINVRRTGRAVCFWCNSPLSSRRFTRDHLIPRVVEPPDVEENWRPACTACNTERGEITALTLVGDRPVFRSAKYVARLTANLAKFRSLIESKLSGPVREWCLSEIDAAEAVVRRANVRKPSTVRRGDDRKGGGVWTLSGELLRGKDVGDYWKANFPEFQFDAPMTGWSRREGV
jgi:hypothetical protein